ncbi:uncharacterized protein LOC135943622 [Cloeon dipterum]|uniref:uncharacterized protein LOC135943622 n=1 Tax=Cloeon dipterum TaxID=197152 RepID=UPI00321FCCBC
MTTTSSATLLTDSSQGVLADPSGPSPDARSPPPPLSASDGADRRRVHAGASQLLLAAGLLVWAAVAVSAEAALAPAAAASGLVGGLFALAAGLAGLAARRAKLAARRCHSAAVVAVAASAISLAACSLVLALAATGLLRDANRPATQVTWGAVMANVGLLLTSGLLAAACLVSVALWRKDAGLCSSRRPDLLAQPLPDTPPAPHKHKLVNNWLGQQPPLFIISPMSAPTAGSIYGGSVAPHIVPLHMPPPPMVVPPYMLPHPLPPPCVLHTLPHEHRERRVSRHKRSEADAASQHSFSPEVLAAGGPEKDPREAERLAALAAKRQRAADAFTDEEVEQSYTGLDRVIAEDFISQTIERHQSRANSTADDHCVVLENSRL